MMQIGIMRGFVVQGCVMMPVGAARPMDRLAHAYVSDARHGHDDADDRPICDINCDLRDVLFTLHQGIDRRNHYQCEYGR